MIDPLPVGYIGLDQAVLRLRDKISDLDYQQRMCRFREALHESVCEGQRDEDLWGLISDPIMRGIMRGKPAEGRAYKIGETVVIREKDFHLLSDDQKSVLVEVKRRDDLIYFRRKAVSATEAEAASDASSAALNTSVAAEEIGGAVDDQNSAGRPDLLWPKREFAILDLYVALSDGSLTALVREPTSGEMFKLTTSDWCGAAFRRDIIIGGVVRAAACEEIERHNRRRVLVEEDKFAAWLRKKMERRPMVAGTDCRTWLEREMRTNPQRTRPKDHWRTLAKRKFGISGRSFDREWAEALRNTGAQWNCPGAPSKLPK